MRILKCTAENYEFHLSGEMPFTLRKDTKGIEKGTRFAFVNIDNEISLEAFVAVATNVLSFNLNEIGFESQEQLHIIFFQKVV